VLFLGCVAVRGLADEPKPAAVTEVPKEVRETLKLDPFYKKHTSAGGLPVLSSDKVSDKALVEAAYLIEQMLSNRKDVLESLIKNKVRFVVMAPTEMTTDVPEQRNMTPKDYWDKRARGLGGRVTSCGEENLLTLRGDRYFNENILVHEFSHAIHNFGLRKLDTKFDTRLREIYARAMDKELWKKTYAATNHSEYWAEGVQSYFDCNAPAGGVHNDINTREKLKKYDPDLFELIDESFKQPAWRYVRYDKRKQTEKEKKPEPAPDEETTSPFQRPRPRPGSGVEKGEITPHWFADNTRFWYRNDLRGGVKEFVLVDAEKGKRQPAFDHEKLASGLSKAADAKYQGDKLPFDSIEFVDDGKAVRFKVGGTTWKCDLESYECTRTEASNTPPAPVEVEVARRPPDESLWPDGPSPSTEMVEELVQRQPETERGGRSPDGAWTAFIKDSNVFVRSKDGKEVQLSKDGKTDLAYGMLSWSPDSKALAAFRIEPGERKEVHLIESSPPGGGRAKLTSRPYPLPGDRYTAYELNLFDVANEKQTKPKVERTDFGTPRLRWKRDSHIFTYGKTDRGHQRFRLIEVDALSGDTRDLIDEKTETFIWSAHTESVGLSTLTWLDKSDEILYASERDGWRHLYLIDTAKGEVKNQVTRGEYVVRGIDRIDETARQIWFRASGKNEGQDPYLIHFYRINFDGTGLAALTEGNGNHSIQYSPDRKYIIDSYNRVDLPPVHELRRVSDGKLVCELEKVDPAPLKANGWEAPEVFVAKGRDGKTDIWGIIARPRNLDPNKKYPVIEYIYAGPQGSFVPKTFSLQRRFSALTDLGFIVVQIDGMGTANRSKAFHDVCWKNLKDAGFPDRILWHQAMAKKYAYYDTTRVGIYGTSAGGQNACGAVLFHGDFYKAAVAACGCHDNRMDKASWNEQWMGYPVGPQYAASSNVDNAKRLTGKLFLIVGELDDNVPPESTIRVVDALVKASKDFDLLVLPGQKHTNGGQYGNRRLQDFFVRHLQGVAPPDRNAPRRDGE
jgi:dipeptidyl aminopeptidase/acylaminoacyl peptidase